MAGILGVGEMEQFIKNFGDKDASKIDALLADIRGKTTQPDYSQLGTFSPMTSNFSGMSGPTTPSL